MAGRRAFQEGGFMIFQELLPPALCTALNERLERILEGDYDTGRPPSKAPGGRAVRRNLGRGGGAKTTLRIVDAWRCDQLFQSVVCSEGLGRLAAALGGWPGARVAEDQVWIKPPGAGPLVFHRDSPYFDFVPDDVITIWIALDPMVPEIGPLQYAVGSHRWGEGRRGTAAQFFDSNHQQLMADAAKREGFRLEEVELISVLVPQGGAGIHDGRTWHGSGDNKSQGNCRRGLGIHFVPADVAFRTTPKPGFDDLPALAARGEVSNEDHPVTFRGAAATDEKDRASCSSSELIITFHGLSKTAASANTSWTLAGYGKGDIQSTIRTFNHFAMPRLSMRRKLPLAAALLAALCGVGPSGGPAAVRLPDNPAAKGILVVVVVLLALAVLRTLPVLFTYWRVMFFFWFGGRYEEVKSRFPGLSNMSRGHLYSLAMVPWLMPKPHYRTGL
eukprot:s546_g7.t2